MFSPGERCRQLPDREGVFSQKTIKPKLIESTNFPPFRQLADISLYQAVDRQGAIESKKGNYKKRFLISLGSKIKSVETTDIAYFYVMEKSTFLFTMNGKSYPVDFSLDKLEGLVDPDLFFRINRQNMVNYSAIEKLGTTAIFVGN